MSKKPIWELPESGDSFETKTFSGIIVSEHVYFIPDESILNITPPYIKGKPDSCWVKYRKGERPTTKKEWENEIGLSLQTML